MPWTFKIRGHGKISLKENLVEKTRKHNIWTKKVLFNYTKSYIKVRTQNVYWKQNCIRLIPSSKLSKELEQNYGFFPHHYLAYWPNGIQKTATKPQDPYPSDTSITLGFPRRSRFMVYNSLVAYGPHRRSLTRLRSMSRTQRRHIGQIRKNMGPPPEIFE